MSDCRLVKTWQGRAGRITCSWDVISENFHEASAQFCLSWQIVFSATAHGDCQRHMQSRTGLHYVFAQLRKWV